MTIERVGLGLYHQAQQLGLLADRGYTIVIDMGCYSDPGHSWGEWLEEYLEPWYKGIFRTVKSQYTTFMSRVTRFLITGGSSHLIHDRLQGFNLFVVMPEPQFANVYGLFPGDLQLMLPMRSRAVMLNQEMEVW